jgi:hypothetical protein
MELASFSPPQIKRIIKWWTQTPFLIFLKPTMLKLFFVVYLCFCLGFFRVASLEKDVFDALMLVKVPLL